MNNRCPLMPPLSLIVAGAMALGAMTLNVAATEPLADAQTFERSWPGRDTLDGALSTPEHRDLLEPITWQPAAFDVRVERPRPDETNADWLIAFPSPHGPQREADDANGPVQAAGQTDRVYLEWYVLRDDAGQPQPGPAMVIIPESDRRRLAAKALAMLLREQGVHGLVLQPPGYGRRGPGGVNREMERFVPHVRQAVADARRARDALRALPPFADQAVHLAGISLGGFLATLTAELDHGYDGLHILLAGGNLHEVVTRGDRDAAKVRQRMEAAGYQGDKLRELLWHVEPLRAADRLQPEKTWLYSGQYDTVVPPSAAHQLADAAGLPRRHHLRFPTGHYTSVLFLPQVALHIAHQIDGSNPTQPLTNDSPPAQ